METFILRERVKRQMTGATDNLVKLVILICWRISMRLSAKLLEGQACLAKRAGSSRRDILAEDGERLPQGKGLESQYPFRIGAASNLANQCEVVPQPLFFYNINRSLDKIKD